MQKLEKIYAGFYGYGEYSIEHRKDDYWEICNQRNEFIKLASTLKLAVQYLNKSKG